MMRYNEINDLSPTRWIKHLLYILCEVLQFMIMVAFPRPTALGGT